MENKDLNIYRKINLVKSQVHFVKKANLNDKLGYNAVSSSMVLAPLAKSLVEAGLILISECTDMQTVAFPVKTKYGESTHYKASISMVYTWVNIDKPEEKIVCNWRCEGVNTSAFDKAVGAAYTYSEKYFMLKFFNIATDDTDPDFRSDDEQAKTTDKPKATQKPTTKQVLKIGDVEINPNLKIKLSLASEDLDKNSAVLGVPSEALNSCLNGFNSSDDIATQINNLELASEYWTKKKVKVSAIKAYINKEVVDANAKL